MVAAVTLPRIATVSQHCWLSVARALAVTVTITVREASSQRHARACATVLDVASDNAARAAFVVGAAAAAGCRCPHGGSP